MSKLQNERHGNLIDEDSMIRGVMFLQIFFSRSPSFLEQRETERERERERERDIHQFLTGGECLWLLRARNVRRPVTVLYARRRIVTSPLDTTVANVIHSIVRGESGSLEFTSRDGNLISIWHRVIHLRISARCVNYSAIVHCTLTSNISIG